MEFYFSLINIVLQTKLMFFGHCYFHIYCRLEWHMSIVVCVYEWIDAG